jgi:hypothetical protein
MNEKLLFLLDGYEECYPLNMEEQYPRVMNRITELWNAKEIDAYFTDLMIDNCGGTRQGFPPRVASKIFALNMAHANILDKKKKITDGANPWDGVEASKKIAVEQQGYAYSPRGFVQSAEKGDRQWQGRSCNSPHPQRSRCQRQGYCRLWAAAQGSIQMRLLAI